LVVLRSGNGVFLRSSGHISGVLRSVSEVCGRSGKVRKVENMVKKSGFLVCGPRPVLAHSGTRNSGTSGNDEKVAFFSLFVSHPSAFENEAVRA